MTDLMRDDGGRWRERHDGWTGPRRAAFLDELVKTGCVRDACRAVGMSNQAAYRLRRRCPDFAAAWDRALTRSSVSLEDAAWTRAVQGWEEPVYQGGRLVGSRRRYSDSLLRMLVLRGDLAGGQGARGAAGAAAAEIEDDMTEEEAAAEVIRRMTLLAARHAEEVAAGLVDEDGNDLVQDPTFGGHIPA